MLTLKNIIALRMDRHFLNHKANVEEYIKLYRDTQPGQNVYWNGFGDPPSITYRANFDDIEFNRQRQSSRELLKGRFQGGNLGWIVDEDLELFACMCNKTLDKPTKVQQVLLDLIYHEGPLNIQQMKEITGMLVKEITPVLHRLQEAFLIYEDQYNGEWDRGWYIFSEKFPNVNLQKYTRIDALKIILQRFSYRQVLFDENMVKSFYKLPSKDIKLAINDLLNENILVAFENGYLLKTDFDVLQVNDYTCSPSVFVLHRNDFLVKSNEDWLKKIYKRDGSDILQYIMVDGEIIGAALGQFKYGSNIIGDVIIDLPESEKQKRKKEIMEEVYKVNNHE